MPCINMVKSPAFEIGATNGFEKSGYDYFVLGQNSWIRRSLVWKENLEGEHQSKMAKQRERKKYIDFKKNSENLNNSGGIL